MIRDTSLLSYDDLKAKLPERRKSVLAVIEQGPVPLFQIARALGWPMHSTSGRVTELVDAGLVEDSGERAVNPATLKQATVWRATYARDPQLPLL